MSDFCILRPPYEIDQEEILSWIGSAHAHSLDASEVTDLRAKITSLGLGQGKIEKRGSVLSDCLHQNWSEMEIYQLSKEMPFGRGLSERMALYDKVVSDWFESLYPPHIPLSPHLIHVSCTGYVSPSGAQKIVSMRASDTQVTHAYHMGCYGAIPALRMALGHWKMEEEETDIVHTEICSLHMNPSVHTTEQLVVQSLFGDGCIKYTLGKQSGFDILALHEYIVPNSSEQMTWGCRSAGFYLTIDKAVPVSIKRATEGFLNQLFKKSQKDIKEDIYFAIHPGGPKIIEQIVHLLQLKPPQIQHSLAVLKEYGNMSSATLPHIWQRMLEDPEIPSGAQVVSLAFGPGLTIAGALFEKAVE